MLYFRKAWDSRISNIRFLWFYPDFCAKKPNCPTWKTDSWAPTSVRGPTVRGPIGPSISWWCLGLLGLLGLWASHVFMDAQKTWEAHRPKRPRYPWGLGGQRGPTTQRDWYDATTMRVWSQLKHLGQIIWSGATWWPNFKLMQEDIIVTVKKVKIV